MRLLEVVLILLNLALLVGSGPLDLGSKRGANVFPLLTLIILILHLIFELYRWQMLSVYIVTLILTALWLLPTQELPRFIPIIGMVLAGLGLVMGTTISILLPIPRMPATSGPYQVGTRVYYWVDEDREEIYGPEPGGPRELMVQVWYPATPEPGARKARWTEDADVLGPGIANWVSLPEFMWQHVNLPLTNSYRDAPMRDNPETYPMIVYIHGWGGFRNINQDQLEELASHGYIVFSADHTYGAIMTVLPDGRAIGYDPDALPEGAPPEIYDPAAEKLVDTYAGDGLFILDQIEALNTSDDVFSGRLDLARIGMFGHSTGGGALVEICAQDDRCQAMLGMDTWIIPSSNEFSGADINKPVMFMNSEDWDTREGGNIEELRTYYDRQSGPRYWMTIVGTAHYDFVLTPLFSPLAPALGLKGPLKATRVIAINHAYPVAFFDTYLKNEESALIDSRSTNFPEVEFERED